MWCHRCQQDVPAVAMIGDATIVCCARCGNALPRKSAGIQADESAYAASESFVEDATEGASSNGDKPSPLNELQLEEDLDAAERLARRVQTQCHSSAAAAMREALDSATFPTEPAKKHRENQPVRQRESGSLWGWSIAGIGLSGLVCGCALVMWSLLAERPELWNIGLPAALVGQAVLAGGLLLHFDSARSGKFTGENGKEHGGSTVTHLHVHAGGLQPQGVSVHYGGLAQTHQQGPVGVQQLQSEIETALRRHAA